MKLILQNIQNLLSLISNLNYVDEDWGQLDYYSANHPVKWPCCLIDINSVNYSNIGIDRTKLPINRQLGEATVKITLANLKLTNTSSSAPQVQKDKAWLIWDILEKVHQKLHGFSPSPNCSKLIRTSMQRTLRDDGIQVYEIVYTFEVNNI